jgi:RimJ/RimL family protein N-acetyltransferase
MTGLKKTEEMEYNFDTIIEGEFITLKKVELEDASEIYKWRTSESGRFLRHPSHYSLESQIKWIKSRTDTEINFIIYSNKSMEKVGMIGIYDVNFNDKVTTVGRLLLSESYLKKSNPYGLEALLLIYDYVFNKMLFRKITGDILESNVEMFKLQKYLGMKQEGYLNKHVLINNNLHDLYIMSIFNEEFKYYQNKIKMFLYSFRETI